MKKSKISLSIVALLSVLALITKGQTNVSGGIYSNTTWTAANSPYIVVDTIVVFPGVTLTIQPGVTVKFDNNKRLEIRQAKLIAVGTSNDSITFTSNSSSPTHGIWGGVSLNGGVLHSKFNYCNFRYANYALNHNQSDTLNVRNSNFVKNNMGLWGLHLLVDSSNFNNNNYSGVNIGNGSISNCTFLHNQTGIHGNGGTDPVFNGFTFITNCLLDSNQTGVSDYNYAVMDNCIITHNQIGTLDNGDFLGGLGSGYSTIKNCIIDSNTVMGLCLAFSDSVINCQIKHNGIGLSDSVVNLSTGSNFISGNTIGNNGIGIKLWAWNDFIICNKICNNSTYDLYYNVAFSNNDTVGSNFWCATDSSIISAKIYDGFDNINLGLVSFMPIDTSQCYLQTGISINVLQSFPFNIFPNPASDYLTLELPSGVSNTEIIIFNLFGEIKHSSTFKEQTSVINISDLSSGIYLIEVVTDNNISRQKFIKQ